MIFFASILVAGLASTSWAHPAAQTANNGASSSGTAPADCAVLATAFPTVFNSSVNCCTVGLNACNNGRLTTLWLGAISLNGSIPDLSSLTQLKIIDFSGNQLTGSIPDMFGSMTQLDTLSLNNNQLTGSLPPSLLNSPSLKYLYLNDNSGLTGQFGDVPSTNLSSIISININNTGLKMLFPLAAQFGLPVSETMPSTHSAPPGVPQGGGNDPWVTWLDPEGNWHNQQVHDPTPLLNGNYVVSAIGGVNICSGNWAFLYEVPNPNYYPSCQGNFGKYNTGDNWDYGMPSYSGLQYGTCPKSVYHWGVTGNLLTSSSRWGTQTYSNCWTGYSNWKTPNSGDGGISVFPNGMRVGYCCFN